MNIEIILKSIGQVLLGIALTLAILFGLVACQTTGIMTKEEVRSSAIAYFSRASTQDNIRQSVANKAGLLLKSLSVKDRTLVANGLFGLAKGLYAFSTGEGFNITDFDGIIKTYAPELTEYTSFIADFSLVLNFFVPNLQNADDPKLWVTFMTTVGMGLEAGAEPYRSK